MSCLHRDEALKEVQFFTSHWPKAGPPDTATQPPVLTKDKDEKEHFVKKKNCNKKKSGSGSVLISSQKKKTWLHLAGACSNWWRWWACWRRWSASGTPCRLPPPSGPSNSAFYCLPHFHLVNYWWRPAQTCQDKWTDMWGRGCQNKSIKRLFSLQEETPVFHGEKRTLAVILHHGIFMGLFTAGNLVAGMSITYPGLKYSVLH